MGRCGRNPLAILRTVRLHTQDLSFLRPPPSSASLPRPRAPSPPALDIGRKMAEGNIGAQAASTVDEKVREFRELNEEINGLRSDLGTLMAQRNENEMVKQVRTNALS